MSKRRVVVTGLGLITPLGNDVESSWNNIVNGKSGIGPLENFDVSAYTTRIGGSVKNFDVTDYMEAKEARKMDTFIQYGMAAGIQAIEDSGIAVTEENAARIGLAIGSGIGGVSFIEKNDAILIKSGPRRISPFFVPGTVINMVAGNLSIKYGMQGPNSVSYTHLTLPTSDLV